MDLKGHVVLPQKYDTIQFVAPDRYIGYFGRESSSSWFHQPRYSTKMSLFDRNGVELPFTDDILEQANIIPNPDNLPVGTGVNSKQGSLLAIGNNNGVGLCDRFGHIVVPCAYRDIVYVGESKFVATKVDADNKPELFLLDSRGNVIASLSSDAYIQGAVFHDGILKIGSATYLNDRGKVISAGKYESGYEFSDGLAAVTFKSGNKKQSGFLNVKGDLELGPFDGLELLPFRKGLALVKLEATGKFGAINRTGDLIIPTHFDELVIAEEDGSVLGKRNGRYLTMTNSGEIVKELPGKSFTGDLSYSFINTSTHIPFSIDAGDYYANALPTSFEKKTLWGATDSAGKVIIKPKFGYVSPFTGTHATATVKRGKRRLTGVIDYHGHWTLSPMAKFPAIYLISKDRVYFGTGLDVEKSVEESWKGNCEENRWYATEKLVAQTLEHYNLIGMKLSAVTKLMGEGDKDKVARPGPRGICERRTFGIPQGCLGSASFELGFDAKQKLVGWQIRHGETQENWIFENVVSFMPVDRYRSDIGFFIPKKQRASLRKMFP